MTCDDNLLELSHHDFPLGLHLDSSNSKLVAVDASKAGWQKEVV